jgi:hypothetical protein
MAGIGVNETMTLLEKMVTNFADYQNKQRRLRPVLRYFNFFIGLMLVVILVCSGQTQKVQAALSGDPVIYSMKILNPKSVLKCGEVVSYIVQVDVGPQDPIMPTPAPDSSGSTKGLPLLKVKVEAFSTVPAVGDFVDAKKGKATAKTLFTGGDDDLSTLGAKIKFKAKKAGTTILYFDGTVMGQYVSFNLPVRVKPCKFKVTTVSRFVVPGLKYTATMDETDLTENSDGSYTGTGKVNWVGWWQVIPPGISSGITCSTQLTAPPSQVDLSGTMNDDGYLDVNITFQPGTAPKWSAVCRDSSGSTPPVDTAVKLAATPLKISAPASTGGVSTQPQYLVDEVSGSVVIDIFSEDDQATSYTPETKFVSLNTASIRWMDVTINSPMILSTMAGVQ